MASLKDHVPVKVTAVCLLIIVLSSVAGATSIEKETHVVTLGSPMEVEISIDYTEFTSEQVSTLVPTSHNPQNVRGEDPFGSIACESEDNEILCDPSVHEGNYSVTIRYETPTTASTPAGAFYNEYSHTKRILETTDVFELRVHLPEGYGLIEDADVPKVEPESGDPQSEGRQIYVRWREDDLHLTDRKEYTVRYEELDVFESFSFPYAIILSLLAVIGIGAGLWIYSNQQDEEENDTIAAVLPILKEDEQDVLRYMIEQDGSCEQKAIVQDLSYSKAKVSRLLKDLEERNLVEKIKEGRKNRVELAKEIGDVDL